MLKVLAFCLLNSTLGILFTKPGLKQWSKLRMVSPDNNSDISKERNASFTYCLCLHKNVCKMDTSEPIHFGQLCPCWRYDHNQSWPYFQFQEANKDEEERKDSLKVHFYPCNVRKDVSSHPKLTYLIRFAGCPRTKFQFLQDLFLREMQRLCTWAERTLRTWQLLLKKDRRGRRLRRALETSTDLSPSMTPAVATHTEAQSTSPSLSLSTYLLTAVEYSRRFDEISFKFSSAQDIHSLERYVSAGASLTYESFLLQPIPQQTTALVYYSLLRGVEASIHTTEHSWTGTSGSIVPPSDVTLSLFTFYSSDSAVGRVNVTQDSNAKLWNETPISENPISVEMSSSLHPSPDLTYMEDGNWEVSDTLQKTLFTEELHHNSPTSSFVTGSSYGLISEMYVNPSSESPWLTPHALDKIYTDAEMSSYISLVSSDANSIDDVADVKPTSFEESIKYLHQSLFQEVRPTSRKTPLPGSDGIRMSSQMTLTPYLPDGEMIHSSGGVYLSTRHSNSKYSPSDFSGHNSMSRDSVIESAGYKIIMETSDTLILQGFYRETTDSSVETISFLQTNELKYISQLIDSKITLDQATPPTPSLLDENMQASEGNFWSTFNNQEDHSDATGFRLLETSKHSLSIQSFGPSVQPVPFFKPHSSEDGNHPVSSDDGDIDMPMSLTVFLPEEESMQTLVGYVPSTSKSPRDFSDPSPVFSESTSASGGFEMFSETTAHTMLLQHLATYEQTVPLLQLKESDHSSLSLPISHEIMRHQSLTATDKKMQASVGILWSTFNNQGEHSDSSILSLQTIRATTSYKILLETSTHTLNVQSFGPSVQTVPFFKPHSSDYGNHPVSSDDGDIDMPISLTVFLPEEESMQTLVGYVPSTSKSSRDFSDPRPVFSESTSASGGFEMFSETTAHTMLLQHLATYEQTVPLLQLTESDHSSLSLPISHEIMRYQSLTSTDKKMQASVGILWSTFNNQGEHSDSSLISPTIISTTPGYEIDSSLDKKSNAMAASISITDVTIEQTSVGNLWSTLNLSGDIPQSTAVSNMSDIVISGVSLEPRTPTSTVQMYESDYGDQNLSMYDAITSKTLDASLTNTLKASLIMQPMPTLEETKLFFESTDSVTPNKLFFSISSDSFEWDNPRVHDSKISVLPISQEPLYIADGRTTGFNMVDSPTQVDGSHSMSLETLESSLISLFSQNGYSVPSALTSHLESHAQYHLNQTKPTISQWLTAIVEEPRQNSTESSLEVSTYYPTLVKSNSISRMIVNSDRTYSVRLSEPLTTSQETVWPHSSIEYQLSSGEIEFSVEFSGASSLHSSHRVATEQFSLDDSQHISFPGLYRSQYPVSVSLAESMMSDVHTPVMETRVNLNDSEIVIDRPQTEALSPTATTHLLVMTESIFDLASNGLYTPLESVGPNFSHMSSDALSATLAEGLLIHSKSETMSTPYNFTHDPMYGEGFLSTLNIDFHHSLSSLPFLLSKPGSLSSGSDYSRNELKETASETEDVFVSVTETYIVSLESFTEAALTTLSTLYENMERVLFEKSASLHAPIESSHKFVFTSIEEFHLPQSTMVSTNRDTEDSGGFTKPDSHTPVTQISSLNVQQIMTSKYSGDANIDTESLEQFLWHTQSVSHPSNDVHSTGFSAEGNEHTLSPTSTETMGLSSGLHQISNTFHTIPLEFLPSTASMAEMINSEAYTSKQISDEIFLFKGTVHLSESEMKTSISLSSEEKSYLDGITPSLLIPVSHLSSLMTTVTTLVFNSEAPLNSVRSVAVFTENMALLSTSFSTISFSRTSVRHSLHAVNVWQSAGSSLFSPSGGSTGPHSPTNYQLSLSPSSIRMSERFMRDLRDGLSTVTLIDSDSNTLRSDLQPTASFGRPASLNSTEATPLYRNALPSFTPPSQSGPVMTLPTGVTAVVTPSPRDTLNLPSVTKTIPISFNTESTAEEKAPSTSLLPVSSLLSLKQFQQPLQSPPATIAGFSLAGKDYYSSTFTAAQAASINTELPMQLFESQTISPLSVSSFSSSSQPSFSTVVLTSASSPSLADSNAFNMISFNSTLPVISPAPFTTALLTPPLPTAKAAGLIAGIPSSSTTASPSTGSSEAASSLAHISVAGSDKLAMSLSAQASQAVTPPGSAGPYTSAPSPSIRQEHLLEITLQVNGTTNIFEESFQTVLSRGLLLTFLQASQLNQTRARRGAPLITVEIFTLSRLGADNVLVQFAVLEDGNPMKAADVVKIFNRLPDLLGTLNDNLPFLVVKAPSAVTLTLLAELTQVRGWLAAVVVLAVVCVVLAALLGVCVKKSQGTERPDRSVQRRAFTPFKEGQLHAPGTLASATRSQQDAELGEGGKKEPSTVVISGGPDPRTPGRSAAASGPHRAPTRRKRPVPAKEQKKKRKRKKVKNHQVTPVESGSEESPGDCDSKEATPGTIQMPQEAIATRNEDVAHTHDQYSPLQFKHAGPQFKNAVTPLPPLLPQRLTGPQDSDKEVELRPTGNDSKTQGLYRRAKAQSLVRWAPGAIVDRDQQRKADGERLRNKKRLREKQRQSQRDVGGQGAGVGPRHGHGGRADEEGPGTKRRSKAGRERDLAAWRRVQAQISSLLEPELEDFNKNVRTIQGTLAFPRSPVHLQGYSQSVPLEFPSFAPMVRRGHPFYSAGQQQPPSSQLANNFGPGAQPWQKAPIPNTRHNAEFLHGLQMPCHSLLYAPSFIPPPHPSFYPPPSGLPESLVDGGRSFTSGQLQSPSHQSGQAARTAQMNGAAAYLPDNPLLSPGSQNYLQLLTSLNGLRMPDAEGKRKAKRSTAKDDGGKSQPPDGELSDAGSESG